MNNAEPPLTRRELRERERRAQSGSAASPPPAIGKPSEPAAPTATHRITQAERSAPQPGQAEAPATLGLSAETGTLGLSRKELRRLREAAERAGVAPAAEQSAPPGNPAVSAAEVNSTAVRSASPAPAAEPLSAKPVGPEPVARPLIASQPGTPGSPTDHTEHARSALPTAAPSSVESLATGPIRWTDALSLPADIDPTDPVSNLGNVALVSDSSTIVIEELPGVNTPTTLTGEIDIVVTGTIHLPASLAETGALPDTLDSAEVVANEDVVDEPTATGMTPISASAAVSAQAAAPQIVQAPPREPVSTGMILALVSAGVAGVAIIAVGVGALFNLF